jgi:hypothetical protein
MVRELDSWQFGEERTKPAFWAIGLFTTVAMLAMWRANAPVEIFVLIIIVALVVTAGFVWWHLLIRNHRMKVYRVTLAAAAKTAETILKQEGLRYQPDSVLYRFSPFSAHYVYRINDHHLALAIYHFTSRGYERLYGSAIVRISIGPVNEVNERLAHRLQAKLDDAFAP